MAIPILTAAEMQEIDRLTIEQIGILGPVLMEQAGRACAEEAERLLESDRPGRFAIVCGKGNNGGDGLVAARHLLHSGHEVEVFLLAEPDSLKGDALLNRQILDKLGVPITVLESEDKVRSMDLSEFQVIVDALFGTGLSKTVGGRFALAIDRINDAPGLTLAVDLPSGLSADSGQVLGCATRAKTTVSFGAPKRGQLLYPGAELVGDLVVADIGFPPGLFPAGDGSSWLMTEDDLLPYTGLRRADAHKGDFGHLLVLAGSANKPGAAALCCQAACRAGAGLVTLAASPETLARTVVGPVEFMGQATLDQDALTAAAQGKSAVAIGPGLGQSEEIRELVEHLALGLDIPVVIDADGLNILAGDAHSLAQAPADRILTPHPGEMARLLGVSAAEVQQDRFGSCRKLARLAQSVVVLKGAGTLVSDPLETTFMVPTGNPGMASGGSGDVLTGIIGALLGQGLSALEAACVGAYLHGAAGDLAALSLGQRAQTASDLIEYLPQVLSRAEGFTKDSETG